MGNRFYLFTLHALRFMHYEMAYIWRETFSNIRHSGLAGILGIIIVALTMMMFSTLLIIANYFNTELDSLKKSPFVVAYLKDGLKDSDRQKLQKKIGSLPQVSSVRYISKEDALLRVSEMFSNRKEILNGLDTLNPLPSSFEIEIKAQFLDGVRDVADIISGLPGVDDIQHAEEASMFVKSVETIIIVIFSILGLASIIIICFSTMLIVYIRREEIKIMRLVGSTNFFIRFPLILQGIIQGLIGSVLGLAILYGLFNMQGTLNLLVMDISLTSFLSPEQIAMVIGAGALIGFLGGAIPLRRLIRI